MKTDADLERDVLAELRWEPSVSEKGIGVTAKDGVVTLHGSVPSYAEKYAALVAAERVRGVRAIAQELEIRLPSGHEKSDQALAEAAATALEWDSFVPKGKLTVAVDNAWITLNGDVSYVYQRNAAERAIRNLLGVQGITNLIAVSPPVPTARGVKSEIEAALKRHAELDASHISVETTGRKVTLRGSVASWSERRDAERAAWSAPGVTQVEDLISVGG